VWFEGWSPQPLEGPRGSAENIRVAGLERERQRDQARAISGRWKALRTTNAHPFHRHSPRSAAIASSLRRWVGLLGFVPSRKNNTGRREAGRSHLTGLEVGKLMAATRGTRNEARDRCLLLLMFRHGLRVSEACRLKLEQVDTKGKVLHIVRLKGGLSTTQPLRGDELKAIGAWLRQRTRMQPTVKSFFVSEQRRPLHRSTVNLILDSAAGQPPCPSLPILILYVRLFPALP
jgi:integrase